MEIFSIIYVWKILEGLALKCGLELAQAEERQGRRLKITSLKSDTYLSFIPDHPKHHFSRLLVGSKHLTVKVICNENSIESCRTPKLLRFQGFLIWQKTSLELSDES